MYYAHIRNDLNQEKQTMLSHLEDTAKIANERFCMDEYKHLVNVAGLLHDAGKYSDKYQEYLKKSANGEQVVRGSVNHTFAGVIYILEKYHNGDAYEALTSEFIAYAVGAHHGLFDCIDIEGRNGFRHRLDAERDAIEYDKARNRYFEEVDEQKIESEFREAVLEVESFYVKLKAHLKSYQTSESKQRAGIGSGEFMLGMFARMLASVVMYGDRKNTMEFEQGIKHETNEVPRDFWKNQVDYLEKKMSENFSGSSQTEINKVRQMISDGCKNFAEHGDGIYRISVPTGAGKTLSTLRYAYSLAMETGKQRVIMVIPLLSVLDQNSGVVKEYTEAKDQIGEYHSNIVQTNEQKTNRQGMNGQGTDELEKEQLLSGFWDEPIIITTMYQFLMNLFSDKTTSVTRMSSLANSVIVFDEIQSIPKKDIHMFDLSMNFLHEFFGTSILLSSATQPEFGITKYPMLYTEPKDMITISKSMNQVFKRTEVDLSHVAGEPMAANEIAGFCNNLILENRSVLIICNTRKEAREIYQALHLYKEEQFCLFHLSASMCPQHRRDTLDKINSCLDGRDVCKTICVSTQMVEAGIDFSFETVVRVMAGLDNLVQSAGRCNRSGEYGHLCKVYLIQYKEENLSHLPDIKKAQDSMRNLLYQYDKSGRNFDLFGEESIRFFYTDLFNDYMGNKELDYKTKDRTDTLLNLLSRNSKHESSKSCEDYVMKQAFKEAGQQFVVYEEDTVDVIVPYKEGKNIIEELCSQKACYDIGYRKRLLKNAEQYSVRLWRNQLEKLFLDGVVYYGDENKDFYVVTADYYQFENDGEGDDMGFVPNMEGSEHITLMV